MRVLLAHNYYRIKGGEDVVFEEEAKLLERNGHYVARLTKDSQEITTRGFSLAFNTIWSRQSAAEVIAAIKHHQVDVIHFHNLFPILSSAVFSAARSTGVTVVKTLHNFRYICPKAVFFRDGKACYDCLNSRIKLPAIAHRCYRDNRAATIVVAASSATHRILGTLSTSVDALIAPSEFAKNQYEASSYPTCPIYVKPHFVEHDLGEGEGRGGFAMFAGRLSEEKGIRTLLAAASKVPEVPIKIVGDGPLASLMESLPSHVTWHGKQSSDDVYRLMGDAACLIVPSGCVETFGRVIVEAYARGTPVICSAHGGQAELVKPHLGMQFLPHDADDLALRIREMFQSETVLRAYRSAARQEYLAHYQAERNYQQLIEIYHKAEQNRTKAATHDCHNKLG